MACDNYFSTSTGQVMSVILHFGTFDVSNYGDLLFPPLALKELGDSVEAELRWISPTGCAVSGFTDCLPSRSFEDLITAPDPVKGALIGGGNIIHCLPSKLPAYTAAGRGTFAYGDLWIAPACGLPDETPIAWNAPGVPAPIPKQHHHLVKRALQRVNYLSVRDHISRQFLLQVQSDLEIAVVPDSAWMIDRLWPRETLREKYDQVFDRLAVQAPERTVVLHVNRRYLGGRKLKEVAGTLDAISRYFSAKALLIPFALCHGDEVLAREVANLMTTEPIVLDRLDSLKEITACIALSTAYVGSSMHGLIVASAFEVPGVAVASRHMPKFAGVLSLSEQSDLVVESWAEALDVLKGLDFTRRKLELRHIHERAKTELNNHWNQVRSLFRASMNSDHRLGWNEVYKYMNRVADTTLAIQESEYKRQIKLHESHNESRSLALEIEKERAKSEAKIRGLQAQIIRMQRSYSWRLTTPLRAASKRFPFLGAAVISVGRTILRTGRKVVRNDTDNVVESGTKWLVPTEISKSIESYQLSPNSGTRKVVVYTAVFGDYDTLLLPEVLDQEVDYVCFTDRPRNNYGVWQIRPSPFFHPDSARIARYIKTHPHELFPHYQIAVWVDANIILRVSPRKYIDVLGVEGTTFGLITHPHRDCVYQEADACVRLKKDEASLIRAQAEHYRAAGFPESNGLYETGFMVVSLEDDELATMFKKWWREIETFSRRDQISLGWVLSQFDIGISRLLPDGVSVREDPDFIYYSHKQCQSLSIPPELASRGKVIDPFEGMAFSLVKEDRLESVRGLDVDVIVCVYNALDDVKLCLDSVRENLQPTHRLIIVNDCSDDDTTDYLRKFSVGSNNILLIENERNLGYTCSANTGLAASNADFRIILNSDTIVSEDWSLKLLEVAMRHPDIGIVGPLSNAAGSQSVPDIRSTSDNTAINAIPAGLTIREVDLFLEECSPAAWTVGVPLVHGFCFGVKKKVLEDIGYFDVENFARYYGEENDYCLRAAAAGYRLAIATNTFVYHRKSRSIDDEERIVHMGLAGRRLREIYGVEVIKNACVQGEQHPMLQRIRGKVREYFDSVTGQKS